jgi:hypothetical protein
MSKLIRKCMQAPSVLDGICKARGWRGSER